MNPNEEGKISTANFLKSNLCYLGTVEKEAYRKRIKKIEQEIGENDPGVSIQEFIAFQHFYLKLDVLKARMAQYRYLDYQSFQDVIENFWVSDPFVTSKKIVLRDELVQAIYSFVDIDDSDEITPEEIALFGRQMFGQPKEQKAKEDVKVLF